MSNGELSGYDSAQKDRKNDDLGPWRFAAEIAEVIRSTPPEWSARIGIFGKWGEGKSTILYFLEEMLKPEGNIIFFFNPWAIQDLNELWAEFGTKLLEALASNNLLVEPWWKSGARSIQKKISKNGIADIGEGAADFFGKRKLVKSAFGAVGNWLKPDVPQV
jgi:predicted KAP-like P-loop ATPase